MKDVNDLARDHRTRAFYVATAGRPGPVVIDIPKNVQFAKGAYHPPRQDPTCTASYHAAHRTRDRGADRRGRRPDRRRAAADHLFRRRRHQLRPRRVEALRELAEVDRPAGHLHPDGPGRLSRPRTRTGSACSACMAPFESNNAMHDCDVMLCVGARFDDRVTGRAGRLLARLEEDPHRHRCVLDQQERPRRRPIVGDCGKALADLLAGAGGQKATQAVRHQAVVEADRRSGARRKALCLSGVEQRLIKPQYAIERLYDADPRHATSTSPPKSASTRCGPPSSSTSTSPTAG